MSHGVSDWVRVWRDKFCPGCRGYGVVAAYSWNDFEGMKDCPECKGNGRISVSPKGFHALYPGGPFTGGRESDDD